MQPKERASKFTEMLDIMAKGIVKPTSGAKFALADFSAAYAESGRPGRSSDGKAMIVTEAECLHKDIKEEL